MSVVLHSPVHSIRTAARRPRSPKEMHGHTIGPRGFVCISSWPPQEAKCVLVVRFHSYLMEHGLHVSHQSDLVQAESGEHPDELVGQVWSLQHLRVE